MSSLWEIVKKIKIKCKKDRKKKCSPSSTRNACYINSEFWPALIFIWHMQITLSPSLVQDKRGLVPDGLSGTKWQTGRPEHAVPSARTAHLLQDYFPCLF